MWLLNELEPKFLWDFRLDLDFLFGEQKSKQSRLFYQELKKTKQNNLLWLLIQGCNLLETEWLSDKFYIFSLLK